MSDEWQQRPREGGADVSVVIISYNRCERLPLVVEPLLEDPALLEIVVVVDGSTDGSEQWLSERSRREPRLRYVTTENRGQAAARQTGAEAARGLYLLFLDDDVVPSPGLVSGHRARHGDREDLVVVGYMPIAAPNGRSDAWVVREYMRSYEECCEQWRRDPNNVLERLWAGNFSLSRAGLAAMDGLACRVRLDYHSDKVAGWRARAAGLHGVFAPELVGSHRYERDLRGFRRDCYMQGHDRALLALMAPEHRAQAPESLGDGLLGPAPVAMRRYAVVAASPIFPLLREALSTLIRRLDQLGSQRARDYAAAVLGELERAAGVIDAVRRVRARKVTLAPWDEKLSAA